MWDFAKNITKNLKKNFKISAERQEKIDRKKMKKAAKKEQKASERKRTKLKNSIIELEDEKNTLEGLKNYHGTQLAWLNKEEAYDLYTEDKIAALASAHIDSMKRMKIRLKKIPKEIADLEKQLKDYA